MNAYLSLNTYYLTAPEVELNHGYCDFFLMPDLARWPMVKHSYILELKYLSISDTEEKAEKQWVEAVEQIKQYGQGKKVQLLTRARQESAASDLRYSASPDCGTDSGIRKEESGRNTSLNGPGTACQTACMPLRAFLTL